MREAGVRHLWCAVRDVAAADIKEHFGTGYTLALTKSTAAHSNRYDPVALLVALARALVGDLGLGRAGEEAEVVAVAARGELGREAAAPGHDAPGQRGEPLF